MDKLLSYSELDNIEELVKLLKPAHEFTVLLQAYKYPTISIIIPGVTRLLNCFALCDSSNESIQKIANLLYHDFLSRTFEYFNNIFCITASYLDPRYKKFKYISDNKKDEYTFKAKSYIKDFSKNFIQKDIISIERPAKKSRTNTGYNFSLLTEDSDDEIDESNDITNQIIKELQYYDTNKVELHETSSPLDYFKEREKILPNLSKIAKLLHCIPATSSPSECLFSRTGEITTDTRNRLLPHFVETLMMIKENNSFSKL